MQSLYYLAVLLACVANLVDGDRAKFWTIRARGKRLSLDGMTGGGFGRGTHTMTAPQVVPYAVPVAMPTRHIISAGGLGGVGMGGIGMGGVGMGGIGMGGVGMRRDLMGGYGAIGGRGLGYVGGLGAGYGGTGYAAGLGGGYGGAGYGASLGGGVRGVGYGGGYGASVYKGELDAGYGGVLGAGNGGNGEVASVGYNSPSYSSGVLAPIAEKVIPIIIPIMITNANHRRQDSQPGFARPAVATRH